MGGSLGRNEATARGVSFVVKRAAAERKLKLEGATVVVQGYGNAGAIAARLLAEFGCKVIGVSDSKGGIVNKKGLDPMAVLKHKEATKSVVGFTGADSISNEDLLELPCDILVPAALEKVITAENARHDQGQDRRRGGQRPDDARGRQHPVRQGHLRDPRRPGQRRRRDGVLL